MNPKDKEFLENYWKVRKALRNVAHEFIEVIYDYSNKKVILKFKPNDIAIFEYTEEEFTEYLEECEYDLLRIKRIAYDYYCDEIEEL
jgi:hypothetical protein